MEIIIVSIGLFVMSTMAFLSAIHSVGMLLFIFIIHGLIVSIFDNNELIVRFPIISGVILIVILVGRKAWRGVDSKSLSILGGMVLLLAISSMVGLNQSASLGTMIPYVKAFGFACLVGGVVRTEADFKIMGLYLLLGLGLGAVYAIWQKVTGNFIINSIYQQRAAGLRDDPNDTAMLLISGLPIALYFASSSRKLIVKSLYVVMFIALLYSIILTGSRGALIGLLLMGMMVVIKRPSLKIIAAGICFSILGLVMMPESYQNRMINLFEGKEEKYASSMDNRMKLLQGAGKIYSANPIFGVGLGNFGVAFRETKEGKSMAEIRGKRRGSVYNKEHLAVHNMYVEFFTENGTLAGLLFMFFLYHSYRGFLKVDKVNTESENKGIGLAFMLGLVGMLFCGVFLSQGYNSVLWLYLGIGIAGHKFIVSNIKKTSENF